MLIVNFGSKLPDYTALLHPLLFAGVFFYLTASCILISKTWVFISVLQI
jgi:hypothetical protein